MSTTISGDTGVDKFDGTTIAGHIIQVANYTTGAVATGTALIPLDNTIPQITEGTQFMSLAFTPKKANSKLKITVVSNCFPSGALWAISALFNTLNNDSIGCSYSYQASSTGTGNPVTFTCYIDALNTSSRTYTMRAGCNTAGTVTFNGHLSTAYFGGSLASSITIEEIAQ